MLKKPDGELTFDPEEMADILATRFFIQEPGNVEEAQWDDPPSWEEHPFPPFQKGELLCLLANTSSTSAPGRTGISWALLKLAWEVIAEHVVTLANACMEIGYHPRAWRRVLVVVIPKPDRADYSQAKNYWPISLIECMSKLIEKGVSKRLLYDVDKHHLIHTTQFGTRAHSSTLDTGLTLMHDVQSAMRAKHKCTALLFDIKGFFDNVHKNRLKGIMRNLGYSDGVQGWVFSFLQDRKVELTFNGQTTQEQDQPVGTLQGSPVSPVLSAIYTSPLLTIPMVADGCTLGMYVDDGVIFAEGPDWALVNTTLREQYRVCDEWLRRNNLAIKPEKTELIYF